MVYKWFLFFDGLFFFVYFNEILCVDFIIIWVLEGRKKKKIEGLGIMLFYMNYTIFYKNFRSKEWSRDLC